MQLNRDQLIFIVQVMVDSATSLITCAIPGRWVGQETVAQWKENNDLPSLRERRNICSNAIWQLGWNLSILYARLTDDGISETDALYEMGFNNILEKWADKWTDGKIGIIPNVITPDAGQECEPDLDIPAGVDKLFGKYLTPPTTDSVDQDELYAQGFDAFLDNNNCPYEENSREAYFWQKGNEMAKQDRYPNLCAEDI